MKCQNKTHATIIVSFFSVLLLFIFISGINNSTEALSKKKNSTEAFRVNNSTGLRFELIHADSKYAPFYNGKNLTREQRYQKLQDLSHSGNKKLQARLTSPDSIDNIGYVVKISIGTPPITYHLLLDTGSDLTWIQCQPLETSFHQKDPIFDPKRSSTFSPASCSDHLCTRPYFGCGSKKCVYTRMYEDRSRTQGDLSWDAIKVDDGGTTFRFAFGCSVRSRGQLGGGEISGILGMDNNPVSLPSQLRSRSFSYCFPKDVNLASLLRLDVEIPSFGRRKMHSTPILVRSGYPNRAYNVELIDVTIFGRRLGLESNTFASHLDGHHFLIDSGTSFTFLIPPIYELVKQHVMDYLSRRNVVLAPEASSIMRFDLCYHFSKSVVSFNWPHMVFHLKGGDLVIESSQLFFMEPEHPFFCLAFGKSRSNVLGNYQQRNVRFVFDLADNMLHFGQEDCSADLSN